MHVWWRRDHACRHTSGTIVPAGYLLAAVPTKNCYRAGEREAAGRAPLAIGHCHPLAKATRVPMGSTAGTRARRRPALPVPCPRAVGQRRRRTSIGPAGGPGTTAPAGRSLRSAREVTTSGQPPGPPPAGRLLATASARSHAWWCVGARGLLARRNRGLSMGYGSGSRYRERQGPAGRGGSWDVHACMHPQCTKCYYRTLVCTIVLPPKKRVTL